MCKSEKFINHYISLIIFKWLKKVIVKVKIYKSQ